ncbi:nuclear transport factor 2 family protein [Amycolatopsis roodepoortensis]|uniref:nuclear transport factor 2 family protein n=1 Tax=Amycolatopsis roodepoortensis TaxID=700274 RepID=UPI00214B9792|nr:nuclear transport factor 2 family protein [Amycolatopsis roodepoortensis]UUV32571.1 nuclear transport factor 2 family protein [Amycolatopsis roodepoortensis]
MSERTRSTLDEFFRRMSTGDTDGATELFADNVTWDIPGATELVPWIGPRRNRAEIREFFELLDKGLVKDRFDVERVLVDGPHAVAIGRLRSTIRSTGKVIQTAFTIEFEVNDDGLITKYLLLEDSWHVANAVL